MDVANNATANYSHIQLLDCAAGVPGEQWVPQANGSLKNPNSGRCLDDPMGNTANGTALQIYDCNNAQPQVFSFN